MGFFTDKPAPDPPGKLPTSLLVILVAFFFMALPVIGWFGYLFTDVAEVFVRNESGRELRDIDVVVTQWQKPSRTLSIASLGSGEEVRISRNEHDLRVDISLSRDPSAEPFAERIDLWRGERYVFTVGADLTIRGGYDYASLD